MSAGCDDDAPLPLDPSIALRAEALPAPYYRELQQYYRDRDGRRYDWSLQAALNEARHLDDKQLILRVEDLTAVIQEDGADGLESVALGYFDHLAQSTDPWVVQRRIELAINLGDVLWFAAEPALQLDVRTATAGTFVERTVRGAALRVALAALVAAPEDTAELGFGGLARLPIVAEGLCAIPPELDQCGNASPQDLIRMHACSQWGTPPDAGILEAMCAELDIGRGSPAGFDHLGWSSWEATAPTGPKMPDGSATPPSGCGPGTYDAAIRDLCASMVGHGGGTGAGALPGGGDAFDTLSSTSCFGGSLAEQSASADVGALIEACIGDDGGTANPVSSAFGHVGIHAIGHVVADAIWETWKAIRDLSEYTRKYEHCWPNCHDSPGGDSTTGGDASGGDTDGGGTDGGDTDGGGDTGGGGTDGGEAGGGTGGAETGAGGGVGPEFDLDNPACAELADIAAGGGRTLYDLIEQPGSAPPIGPKVNPHPDADAGLAGPVSCFQDVTLSGATHCNTLTSCLGGTALDPDTCTCQAPVDTSIVQSLMLQNARCMTTNCGPGLVPLGPTCSCSEPLAPPADATPTRFPPAPPM